MPGKREEANFFLADRVYKKRMAELSRRNPKEYEALYKELHRYAGKFADKFSERYKAPGTGEELFFRVLYEQIRWAAYKQRLQPSKFVESLFDEYAGVEDLVLRLQGVTPQSV